MRDSNSSIWVVRNITGLRLKIGVRFKLSHIIKRNQKSITGFRNLAQAKWNRVAWLFVFKTIIHFISKIKLRLMNLQWEWIIISHSLKKKPALAISSLTLGTFSKTSLCLADLLWWLNSKYSLNVLQALPSEHFRTSKTVSFSIRSFASIKIKYRSIK